MRIAVNTINQFISRYTAMVLKARNDIDMASKEHGKEKETADFISQLAASDYDELMLRDAIFDLILASTEASATTMSWILYELSQNLAVVKDLTDEVSRTIGLKKLPTTANLKKMAFLRAVIHETLRLHPAIPFNFRTAAADTTLPRGGGTDGRETVRVLKGTIVIFSLDALHRRDDLHRIGAAADVFDPHRWLLSDSPGKGHFAAFHLGRRPCLGTDHAMMQISYMLCRILQNFDSLECKEGAALLEKASLFNYPTRRRTMKFRTRAVNP